MSKTEGALTKENTARIFSHGGVPKKLSAKGADGKIGCSDLAKGKLSVEPAERVREAEKGGLAVDLALMNKLEMLDIAGSVREVQDMSKAYEIVLKAEKEVASREAARVVTQQMGGRIS